LEFIAEVAMINQGSASVGFFLHDLFDGFSNFNVYLKW